MSRVPSPPGKLNRSRLGVGARVLGVGVRVGGSSESELGSLLSASEAIITYGRAKTPFT